MTQSLADNAIKRSNEKGFFSYLLILFKSWLIKPLDDEVLYNTMCAKFQLLLHAMGKTINCLANFAALQVIGKDFQMILTVDKIGEMGSFFPSWELLQNSYLHHFANFVYIRS